MTPELISVGAGTGVFLLIMGVCLPKRWPVVRFDGSARLANLLRSRRERPATKAEPTPSRRWMPEEETALYEVVEALAAHIQTGQVAYQALAEAVRPVKGPLGRQLRQALHEHQRGTPLASALTQVRGPREAIRQLGAVFSIVEETGGGLADALAQIMAGFRQRRRLVGILQVRTAEARYALQFMAALPLLLIIYLSFVHPELLAPLWHEGAGRWSASYAVCSWGVGIWVMRRLVSPEHYL